MRWLSLAFSLTLMREAVSNFMHSWWVAARWTSNHIASSSLLSMLHQFENLVLSFLTVSLKWLLWDRWWLEWILASFQCSMPQGEWPLESVHHLVPGQTSVCQDVFIPPWCWQEAAENSYREHQSWWLASQSAWKHLQDTKACFEPRFNRVCGTLPVHLRWAECVASKMNSGV